MSVITGFFAYLAANSSQIFNLLLEHKIGRAHV